MLRGLAAALALMFVDFLDELGAGVTPLSAASVRAELGLAYDGAAVFLLVLPLLFASVIEVPLLLRSDAWAQRWPRTRIASAAMLAMALCIGGAASASSAWSLSLWLAAWWASTGLCCGVSEGAMMVAFPDARERWMLRWTLMSCFGDALAPALVLACTRWGASWRVALLGVGALHLLHAGVLARVRLEGDPRTGEAPEASAELGAGEHPSSDEARGATAELDSGEGPSHDEMPRPSERAGVQEQRAEGRLQALREGLLDTRLMAWLFAAALCCLLDEIFVMFGALYMGEVLGAGPGAVAAAFTASSLAAALGALLCERALARASALRALIAASVVCAVAYVAWLASAGGPLSIVLLACVGLGGAPLYPICMARAYARRPAQPGLVASVDRLFSALPVLAPLGLGWVAARWGLFACLVLLLLQPVGVLLVALWAARAGEQS